MQVEPPPAFASADEHEILRGDIQPRMTELPDPWPVCVFFFCSIGVGVSAALLYAAFSNPTEDQLWWGVAAGLFFGATALVTTYLDQRGTHTERLDRFAKDRARPWWRRGLWLLPINTAFVLAFYRIEPSALTVGIAAAIACSFALVAHIIDRWFVAPAKQARESALS